MLENIQSNNKIKNHFNFSLKNGTFKDIVFEAILRVACDNPLCTCQDVRVTIWPEERSDSDYLFLFYLNVQEKKISSAFKKDISPHSMAFAKEFIKEINSEDWSQLKSFHISSKGNQHQNANFEELEIEFDHYEIENNLMTAWHEIFPFSEEISKEINDNRYILDDQYCLKSNCNCTKAVVTFVKIKTNQAIQQKHSACSFNYNKNTLEQLDGPVTDDIKEIIKIHGAEIRKIYKKRHSILRKLYGDYKKRSGFKDTTATPIQKNPGRNDPCPCGSGKKYKKCCMVK